jgi:hypothetical protein
MKDVSWGMVGGRELKEGTCDVQSAGFVVCSECPYSIAQLWGKPRKDSEPAFGRIHGWTMV